jgi:hypothetical protein
MLRTSYQRGMYSDRFPSPGQEKDDYGARAVIRICIRIDNFVLRTRRELALFPSDIPSSCLLYSPTATKLLQRTGTLELEVAIVPGVVLNSLLRLDAKRYMFHNHIRPCQGSEAAGSDPGCVGSAESVHSKPQSHAISLMELERHAISRAFRAYAGP